MLKAMVPVKDALWAGNLLNPLVHKPRDLFKMPTKSRERKDTYFFPVLT